MDLGIAGRRALVLGASRGLGAAVTNALAQEGVTVLAGSRSARSDGASSLPEEVRALVRPIAVDVSNRAALTATIAAILGQGPIDILVNNSGGPPPGPVRAVEAQVWEQHFAAMAANLFEATRLILPGMIERRWGRIITIASSGVEQPIPNLGISNAVRAAIVGWSKTLSNEVASDGITVNVVLPGRIHTQRVDELDAAAAARSKQTMQAVATASRASIPAGRYGTAEEFASVVAFLGSERASYVTGSRVRVDGGAIRSI
ncbi:SDR family oxidoreductase [Lichenicoccus sp.]|uniref:SDR family oxidoreductase n=1 Tax=Lichenicoccus sp. TaxID=2781899 RepID=UPI003D148D92